MSTRETVHGIHAVESLLRRAPKRVESLQVLNGRRDERLKSLLELAVRHGITPLELPRAEMDRIAAGAVHQGVIATMAPAAPLGEAALFDEILPALEGSALLLVLDGVTDPHNLGACLRSANAFGAHAVIAPRDNAAPLNATARKVASGAAELVPFVTVTNLARVLRQLQESGIWMIGTDGEATQPLDKLDLKGPIALVMGAEGAGLRRLTREHCDFLAAIPMSGTVGSLNVAVATGICLYEAHRQRQ